MVTMERAISASTPVRRVSPRLAFCPVCGQEQTGKPASKIGSPEDALCTGRCTGAWHVLIALRQCESTSAKLADRRRAESETRLEHAPTLSQLLLGRWRAGRLGRPAGRPDRAALADASPGLRCLCGDVAEWLGRGLQSLVQRFESARRLQSSVHAGLSGSSVCLFPARYSPSALTAASVRVREECR